MKEGVYLPRKDMNRVNKDGGDLIPAIKVMDFIEGYFGLSRDEIVKVCRKKEILYPRQVASWILANYSGLTLHTIAVIFSQHWSTVLNSLEAIDNYILTDEKAKEQVCYILNELQQHGKVSNS
jgi:chromosomal replication initiation ATPase DnaA